MSSVKIYNTKLTLFVNRKIFWRFKGNQRSETLPDVMLHTRFQRLRQSLK